MTNHDGSGRGKASRSLPPIGCYVKDQYADEFRVRSGAAAGPMPGGRGRWWLWGLVVVGFCVLGLCFGAWQQIQSQSALLKGAQDFAQRALTVVKFPVEQVHIVGHTHTKEADVVRQLGDIWDHSLITLNTSAVQRHVERLPWVREAVIERVFPHRLNVFIKERQAIGRWVTLDGRFVFDQDGVVTQKIKVGAFLNLPIYEGHGAPEAAFELASALERFSDLRRFFARYKRVDGRRWTLIMQDGLKVKMPEKRVLQALNRLKTLQQRHGLLNRDLDFIDLRLEDRVTIRPQKTGKLKVFSTLEDLEASGKIERDSQRSLPGGL